MEHWLDLMTPHVRHICLRLKLFEGCVLSLCRRARTCTGHRREARYNPSFPPCIASNQLQSMWRKEQRRYFIEVFAYHGVPKDHWS